MREYLTKDGRSPFTEWLHALPDRRARAQIRTRLDRLELGDLSDCLPLGEGVFELWLNHGSGFRIYIGLTSSIAVLLMCGSGNSNRNQDIIRAKLYWLDYSFR